jgi:hypothetical protein
VASGAATNDADAVAGITGNLQAVVAEVEGLERHQVANRVRDLGEGRARVSLSAGALLRIAAPYLRVLMVY